MSSKFSPGERLPNSGFEESAIEPELKELNQEVSWQLRWSLEILSTSETILGELSHLEKSMNIQRRLDLTNLLGVVVEMQLTTELLSKGDLSATELADRVRSMRIHAGTFEEGHIGVVRDALEGLLSQIDRFEQ